ncbi:hypothetical protein L249_5991, partial [Ophiocordyceps polyrhachis-furcata BCC 54312]
AIAQSSRLKRKPLLPRSPFNSNKTLFLEGHVTPGRLQPARGRRTLQRLYVTAAERHNNVGGGYGYAVQRLRPYGPYGPYEGRNLIANSTLFFFDLCGRYSYGYGYGRRPRTRPEGLGGSRNAGPAAAGPRPPYVTEAVRHSGCGYGYAVQRLRPYGPYGPYEGRNVGPLAR